MTKRWRCITSTSTTSITVREQFKTGEIKSREASIKKLKP